VGSLTAWGRHAESPAAAILGGSRGAQTVVIGTLATIAARMRQVGLRPPAILVVGDVVSLMGRMRWAENRPLFGRRVLIAASYPDALTAPLEALGAEVLHVAPLESGAAVSSAALDRAIEHLAPAATVLFADEDAVAVAAARLAARGLDARALAGRRIIADGESTAAALGRSGVRADLVLDGWDAAIDAGAGSWLVLGGPDTQASIVADLRRRGLPSEAPALSTLASPKWRADRIRELLTTRPVRAIAFAHATQVRRFVSVLDDEERRALGRLALATSSGSAARALREHGLEPAVVASGPAALAEALAVACAAAGTPG
jgi:uroporphyrinogen III methyltransferase/synthase